MTKLLKQLSESWKALTNACIGNISLGRMNPIASSTAILVMLMSAESSAQSRNVYVGTTEQFVVNGDTKLMIGYLYQKGQNRIQNVEVYIDKPRTKGGVLIAKIAANQKRPDLKSVLGIVDDKVGFRWVVPKAQAFSNRKIFVYPEGQYQVLPSGIAGSDLSIVLAPFKSPVGVSYGVYSKGSEQFLTGWVYDENASPSDMKVQVYVDAPRSSGGKIVMEVPIDEDRSKIAKLNGFKRSDIGFSVLLPGWVRDSGRKLYLTCVSKNHKVIDVVFQKSGRISGDDTASQSLELTRTASPARVLSWSPGIRSPRRLRALSQDPWIQFDTLTDESEGVGGSNLFWLVSTSMENQNYSPVRPDKGMNALLPNDPLYQVFASQLDDKKYSLRMVMDKISGKDLSGADVIPTFLFGAINESFDIAFNDIQKPRIGDNIYVDITYRINKLMTKDTRGILPPKARVSVGVATRYQGDNYGLGTQEKKYVEINLERTQSYDMCPQKGEAYSGIHLPWNITKTNSDAEGIYDSRHTWGLSGHKPGASAIRNTTTGGELVYYDGKAIENWIVKKDLDDGWIKLRIPFSFLMIRYPWQRLPENWNDVRIGGIYLGLEMWGRGFLDWEVKDVNIFSMKNVL